MPDFGYGPGNYAMDYGGRPRNWELLTGIVCHPEKYSWLDNHIKLQNLKRKLYGLQAEREKQAKAIQSRKQ